MSVEEGDARAEVLARIARALGRSPEADDAPEDAPAPRRYRVGDPADMPARRLRRLAGRLGDYRATVCRVRGDAGVATAVAACVAAAGGACVVPRGLPPAWLAAIEPARLVVDDGLAPHALDALAGAVSGCALAVADTGTLILDGGERQGRRAITLVPDRLVVVVLASQVVATVPEAMRRLGPSVRARPTALTLISGPSATSDIELSRVEGVHGPRRLDVVIAEDM